MVPGGGSRESMGAGTLTGSGGVTGVVLLRGGLRRRSASCANSVARRRARSDKSPSTSAWRRQAMRLMSQVRLLAAVASPKTSAKRCRSWPTVRRCSAAISLTMFSSTGFSFLGVCKRSTRVDSEPRFHKELKAIRDKRERFILVGGSAGWEEPCRVAQQGAERWWDEVAQRILASAAGPAPEG